jgi:hypothetical protein
MEANLDELHRYRHLPALDLVATRVSPKIEVVPVPQDGEHVIFLSHFERGFGLSVSPFLWEFLDHFSLRMQSLSVNSILFLSVLVTDAEAYLGVPATWAMFERFFYFRS